MIIKEVFAFIKARGGKPGEDHKLLVEIKDLTKDLFDMHNVKDRDGVPVWYVKQSLEKMMEKLSVAIENQTVVLSKLVDRIVKPENK